MVDKMCNTIKIIENIYSQLAYVEILILYKTFDPIKWEYIRNKMKKIQ